MDETSFGWFIFFVICMLIASFIFGIIPMTIPLKNPKFLDLLTTLGGGLLVGSAFLVVLPEGIVALLAVKSNDPDHFNNDTHGHSSAFAEIGRSIGLSITSGFGLMLLLDQITLFYCTRNRSNSNHIHSPDSEHNHDHSISTKTLMVGLLVHAFCDGIALGASADRVDMSLIIFIAVLIHKAPTAFGLTSLLMDRNIPRKSIRHFLLMFSLAAPIGAVLTYLISRLVFLSDQKEYWSAILLLFSSGTFIYVATVHVLPHLFSGHHSHCIEAMDTEQVAILNEDDHSHHDHNLYSVKYTVIRLTLFYLGLFIPWLLEIAEIT
jgi:zinc transporter 9